MKVSLALLPCTTCFPIFTANFASEEQFYIVISPDSPCPTREQGEPCLTLEQYAANPSQRSTVTLVLEPGNHSYKRFRECWECLQAGLAGGLTNPQVVSYSGLANWLHGMQVAVLSRLHSIVNHSKCTVAVWDQQDVAVLRR